MDPSQTTPAPGSFDGKVAVVTGAARGIGRATAVAMARHESRCAQAIQVGGKQPNGEAVTDVAPAVVFLASDAAHMVSGTTYAVTGGDSANLSA